MGGFTDQVRGLSKIETYLKYAELVDGYGETFQSHNLDPKNKKLCKSLMNQDSATGEWVLSFHLHT